MIRRRDVLAVGMGLGVVGGGRAVAQLAPFPNRPVRIVIGFPPGGGIDIVARLLAPRLTERLGQPVVVENRPGANGVLATQAVAATEPDGHAILFGTTGNLALNPLLQAGHPDMEREFAPLTGVAVLPFILMVRSGLPARTLSDLVALAKARPGGLTFGSSGSGGLPHLAGELLNLRAGIATTHVPYRGSAPALNDLVGERVDFMFDALALGQSQLEAGRVRALANTGATPLPVLGGLPPVGATVPGFEVVNCYGMMVRRGTPETALARLHAEIASVLALPDMRERFSGLGVEPVASAPDAFGVFLRGEAAKWGEVIRAAGVRPD